jgi:uncharacterized protein (DUF433 family)
MSELTKEQQRDEEITKVWMIISNIRQGIEIKDIADSYLRDYRQDLNVCIDIIDKLLGEESWK